MNQNSRLVLSVLALLSASAAFAAPKVGDSATMTGALTGNGSTMKITTSQTIVAYDANTDVYTINQTVTSGSQPSQTTPVKVGGGDMLTEETAAQIVAGCEAQKLGKVVTVSVPAGKFTSCHETSSDGSELWIAVVPFGGVKFSSKTSFGTINMQMTSFTRGQ